MSLEKDREYLKLFEDEDEFEEFEDGSQEDGGAPEDLVEWRDDWEEDEDRLDGDFLERLEKELQKT